LGHDGSITTTVRPGSPARWPTIADEPHAAAPCDSRIFRSAGLLMLLAAGLLAAGSLSPWVAYVLPSGATVGRDAYQFGAGDTLTWFGPIILLGACALAVFGAVTLFHPWHPNVCMPFIPTMVVGLEIVDVWHGGFGGVAHATTTLGTGSFLCFAGIVLGVAAAVLLIPAERVLSR
jgi:hypothetical protein